MRTNENLLLFIKVLKEILDEYERMPDVFAKLLPIEAEILTGRCEYGSNKK